MIIATSNIYAGKGSNFNYLNNYLKHIDVIFTQENNKKSSKLMKEMFNKNNEIETYKLGGEGVGVYSKFTLHDIKVITKKMYNMKNRNSIIVTINGIKIANLHLSGGRYDDKKIFILDFNNLLNDKVKLLNDVIKELPDIILGDFNSVYSSNDKKLQEYINGQYKYFKNIKNNGDLTNDEKKKIELWNSEPYKLLQNYGYIYAKPNNEDISITNGRGKSIIDCVWYKYDKIKIDNVKIIDMINDNDNYKRNICISDHNPITFIVNKK